VNRLNRWHVAFASVCTILAGAACGGMQAPRAEIHAVAQAMTARGHALPTTSSSPSAYVKLQAVSDRSEEAVSLERRRLRATNIRALMTEDLEKFPSISLVPGEATALDIPVFTVDTTIEKLDQRVRGASVEIICELRISVTDQRGKILFLLTNGSTVRVPRKGFRTEFEGPLQHDALEGAVRGINEDLISRIDAETLYGATSTAPLVQGSERGSPR
jgi:hypothetical protein